MIHSERKAHCEEWDLLLPGIPPRSRLYSLEPIGTGTPMVESLTGYVARLAEAHCTSTAVLFGWELVRYVNRAYFQKKYYDANRSMILASSFRFQAGAMNGTGVTARDWVRALESATLRTDLSQLTMIVWSNVISHQHLLRQMHAWCPACYEEQRNADHTVYEPLLWKLKIINVCIRHCRRLRINCHNCGNHVYHLASYSRPGFCPTCRRWLGVSQATSVPRDERILKEELDHQFRLFVMTGEMLAAAPSRIHKPLKQAIADSTAYCVEMAGEGTVISLSKKYKLPTQTLGNWRKGRSVPRLDSLISFCFQLGISPLKFATSTLTIESFADEVKEDERVSLQVPGNSQTKRTNSHRNISRRHRKLNLEEVEQALKDALQETTAPSGIEVARRIDRQPSTLRYHFPDLCKAIVKRHASYRNLRNRREWKIARRALMSALTHDNHPSIADVAREIGWNLNRVLRRFPELCKKVTDRHEESHKRRWKEVGNELETILKEQPPPPMYLVVKRLNYSAATLYYHFRDLCRAIGARHLRYRKELFEERRSQLLDDIRKKALTLCVEGIYPSVKRVEERLENPISLRSSKIGLAVLREIRAQNNLNSRRLHPTRF